MNTKEISELRRRLRPDRQCITQICGCYVSDRGEIISRFTRSLGLMPEDEKEMYLALFRRVLSGTLGRNLIDLPFRTAQVADSEEHRLLMRLRTSALREEEALDRFYQTVAQSFHSETNYVILLAHDSYDVPGRGSDGALRPEDSETVYSYFLCAVCPVKLSKPALRYVAAEGDFHERGTDYLISPPDCGFLFPAFDNRAANLYDALFYTRSVSESHRDLTDAVFRIDAPLPADEQKQAFGTVLEEALSEECSLQLVQNVQDAMRNRIEAHREARDAEMLTVTGQELRDVLEESGVSEEKLASFRVRFDTEFGTGADLTPRNLIDVRRLEVKTPDVVIRVNPERQDLIETKTIGENKYILIRAEGNVEVCGVDITI